MKFQFTRIFLTGISVVLLAVAADVAAAAEPAAAIPGEAPPPEAGAPEAVRNNKVMGCWSDADKGDSADLKIHFVGNGSLVQYDETKTEKNKRTFGAWEMKPASTYLVIYWPSGRITSYSVKRIGPILHFAGMNGASNFTLREIAPEHCWSPEI